MKIIVVGSLNMDTTYILHHIPKAGETIISSGKSSQRGGKGQNQAIQIARLGSKVGMIGAVGSDNEGKSLLDGLKEENIDSAGIIVKSGPSGTASIYLDENGENNIVVYPGANYLLTKEDIDQNIELIKEADYCVLQNEIPLEVIYYVFSLCRKYGVKIVYNPAPALKDVNMEKLGKVDHLLLNETEMEIILGTEMDEDQEENAKKLLERVCDNVILTLGSKGSMLVNKDQVYFQESKKVDAVDTTGAGDSFTGAFVTAISEGKDLLEAMDFASLVSAITVTQIGAVDSLPYLDQVKKIDLK